MKLWIAISLGLMFARVSMTYQQEEALTPSSLMAALAAQPAGAQAEKLAERIRAAFGKENLLKGAPPRIEDQTVAWAIEAPGAAGAPKVVSEDGTFSMTLARIGTTLVFATVTSFDYDTVMRVFYEIDGKRLGPVNLELYAPHPDTFEKPGVPKGKVSQMPKWESKIFAGTTREWWIYVPAQYRTENPACVMVFQDGRGYVEFVPTVFDNLIARGEMPVTAGILVQPGVFADGKPNRSFEYDTLSDQYARFILEEILPEAEKTVKLRHDAESRAIAGISSGGICAFTAAWERPNEFSKVLSWVGSFTNIASGKTLREGGHNYPALIRKTPKKPIRVFLQDGANDLDNQHGNWPLANQEMAKALQFAGYDYKFVFGRGFHSNRHGRALLPDSLRWLWRDWRRDRITG
ncbi:MAG: enterochelin esterase [Acidobacteria bacterium]|nr:MAG: enterochelin esterase [Acidobacteriota bacterium]